MERSFQVLSALEPDENLATLAAQMGRLYFFSGDLERSIERLEFALGIAERLFLPEVLSNALNTKSLVLNTTGRMEESRALLRHALEIAKEHGSTGAIFRAYYNLFLEGPDAAFEHGQRGLELARRLGNRRWELAFLGRQASVQWLRGEWDQALALAQPILDPANARPSGFGLSRALPALAHLMVNRGLIEEAGRIVRLRDDSATSAGLVERADYFTALAILARARGDRDTARRARSEMLAVVDRMGFFHESTRESIAVAIEISLDEGEIEEAERLIAELRSKVGQQDYLATALARFEPRIAVARGNAGAAEAGFRRSYELARASGTPFALAVTSLEFAEWLAARGRDEEAAPFFAEAGAIFRQLRATPWLERLGGRDRSLLG
jgi:tetratricopeptide (TPR) repeat protein